jgi:predicted phage baseplate assembly protein
VRELEGARANVEWRILVSEIFDRRAEAIQELESALAAEGAETDVTRGPLRLRRDRLKRVTEAWVLWEERPTLLLSGPSDRHYALDRARGRLRFGDGEQGRLPPMGALVAARRYRTGGGRAGNVGTGTINQALGPIGGMESVANVAPAEGGADAEIPEAVAHRGPYSVRARGRAVVADDFAIMAREASPSVAVARALPARDASGRPAAGWVTLVIIPSSAEPRPFPSFGLRQQVRRHIEERTAGDIAAATQVVVAGPEYQAVDVFATLVLVRGVEAGAVERAVRQAIETFLHPLRGGPSGQGWSPGDDVYLSDVAAVVERIDGVDYSRELALLRDGMAQGERLGVGAGRIPVAGNIRLRLVEG